MTEAPPLLPRRPRPTDVVDPNLSPPITLETKVPHRVGTFRSSKKAPKEDTVSCSITQQVPKTPPSAPKFLPELPIFQSFANPTYLVMNANNEGALSRTKPPTPDFSDTDSIMFLEKNAPSLVRNGVQRSSSRNQSLSESPHVYEDVPEHVLENNRKIVGSRDIFNSVSFESPLSGELKRDSSESSSSSYDHPRQTSLPETCENPILLAQRQLSASGCFYDFPTFQRRKVSVDTEAAVEESADDNPNIPTYDIPASLGTVSSPGRQGFASNNLYDFPASCGATPLLSRSSSEELFDAQPPALGASQSPSPKEIACSTTPPHFPQGNLKSPVFKERYAYEVPKPRPVLGHLATTVTFPPPPPVSLLYDIPSQLGTAPKSPTDDIPQGTSEDLDSLQFDLPLTPPPSYPPPPPPVLQPPAVPPRNILPSNPSRSDKPTPAYRPVPAKRYSLARQSPVLTPSPPTARCNSPDCSVASELEKNVSPIVSRSSSTREQTRPQPIPRLSSIASDTFTSPEDDAVSPLWGIPKECQSSSLECHSVELSALEEAHMKFSDASTPCESFEWKGTACSAGPTSSDGEEGDAFDEEPRKKVSESISSCSTLFALNTAKWNAERDFAGYIYKTGAKRKGFLKRWSTLQDGSWSYFVSQKDSLPLGSLSVDDIGAVSLSGRQPCPALSNHPELWCFEIHALQSQGRQYLVGVPTAELREMWINKLTALVAPSLPVERNEDGIIQGVTHVGRLHVKEGVGGFWQTTTVCLQGRQLHLQAGEGAAEIMDLRKVMSVGKSGSLTFPGAHEAGPSFQLQLPGRTMYLQADHPCHTESWAASVECAWATPPSPAFSDLYLSPDGIPVVIDRCLNFISTYGTMLTGIYRLAGSSSKVKKLVEVMHQNPWALHLTTDDYTPHDVANALKRYLRSFPDCLLTNKLLLRWIHTSKVEHPGERRKVIKTLLSELPITNFQLLKKLTCHLKSISDHSDKNYMPILNLAPVFGPSLLYGDVHRSPGIDGFLTSGSFEENNASMDIIADLIHGYCSLFEVDPDEIEKERKIQEALNLFRDCKVTQRPAGDILIGVYVYSRDWGHCLNMRLSPALSAEELCQSAISQLGMKETVSNLAVFEVVCNKDLERPLHYTESVLASALRWAAWDSFYAKENFLCIKNNFVYKEISALVQSHQPLSVFSELKYASPRQKSFKKGHFEFTRGKITHHKDAKASQQLSQWSIEDITWYLGCDSRRSPPHKMNITFVPRQGEIKKTRDSPYFGHCLSLATEDEFTKWLAAMVMVEYPTGVFPSETTPSLFN